MKIGLFGGTFDPIHAAHVAMAKTAQAALDLDCVWFIPVYSPPHKEREGLTASEHRVKMIELAISGDSTFSVNPIELQRAKTSYTYETIQQLRAMNPEAEFYFLLGADNVEILASWKNLAYLLSEVTFVAFQRPEYELESQYPLIILPMPELAVSSTAIRQFQHYNQLNQQVLEYMLHHRLYGLTAIHELVYQQMNYRRFIHTMGVVEAAIKLARRYSLNERKCHVAALLHDYAKAMPEKQLQAMMTRYFPTEPFIAPIAHAFVGSIVIQEQLCMTDSAVIEAVRYHTTGHPDMDEIAKCIFIADYIEPNRRFPGVETARLKAFESLDAGVDYAITQTNAYLRAHGKTVHPDSIALAAKLAQIKGE
ncbi:MAG: nicotinate-nucleotide adenylyltransferase [Culicoidibacterales bacterium]